MNRIILGLLKGIISSYSSKALIDLIISLLEYLAKKTDNTVDDNVVKKVKEILDANYRG